MTNPFYNINSHQDNIKMTHIDSSNKLETPEVEMWHEYPRNGKSLPPFMTKFKKKLIQSHHCHQWISSKQEKCCTRIYATSIEYFPHSDKTKTLRKAYYGHKTNGYKYSKTKSFEIDNNLPRNLEALSQEKKNTYH